MKTLLQIGAGNIGRGYMAQLFFEAGYRIVFADAVTELVDSLSEAGGYNLRVLDAYRRAATELRIEPMEAVVIGSPEFNAEVARASVIATAVGVPNLERVAEPLAQALAHRKDTGRGVNVFLCENTLDASNRLRAGVLERLDPEVASWVATQVGFAGTSVARMVPIVSSEERGRDPLLYIADAYRPLPYDKRAVVNGAPGDIPELKPCDNFAAEVRRKLFLYNLCHASLAYLGAEKEYRFVHETLEDDEYRAIFIGAAREISLALELEYPADIKPKENTAILDDILVRYGNPMLQDSVTRVGRDPLRKLGHDDRLIGPARLCALHEVDAPNILRIIAAAFAYRDPNDAGAQQLARLRSTAPTPEMVRTATGLEQGPLFERIVNAVR